MGDTIKLSVLDSVNIDCGHQVVLLKDQKKVFTLDSLDYEPEAGAIHPGGSTAAVGGAVSLPIETSFELGLLYCGVGSEKIEFEDLLEDVLSYFVKQSVMFTYLHQVHN